MKLGILALRATIGGFFVGHGAQKLFGAQGGGGLKGTAQMFESIGLKPGIAQATAAGLAETGGGAGLLLGYRVPLSSAAVISAMTIAIQRVHGKNGWKITDQGYEYNAVLIAGALAIAEQGPGFLSLDALRGKQRHGLFWALFALGAGVGGALADQAVSGYFGGSAPVVAESASAASEVTESAAAFDPAQTPAPISEPVTAPEPIVEPQGEPLPVESLNPPVSDAPAEPSSDSPFVDPDA